MTPDNIDSKADNEDQQHSVNDQRGGAGIYANDQGQTGYEFNKRQDDGGQVDKGCREKTVAEYNFGKSCGCQYFAVTGIYKGCTEKPACRQFNPAVVKN